MNDARVRINGYWKDLARFFFSFSERARRIRRASSESPAEGRMTALAEALHPVKQELKVAEIREESPSTRTYRLVPGNPGARAAPFLAGQYLSLEADLIGGGTARRPYSISGTPSESAANGAYDVTIKTSEHSFVAGLIGTRWMVGTTVRASAPQGSFTFEPLRDSAHLVCVAGGSGVTPFRSIIGDLLEDPSSGTRIVLIQGAGTAEELLFDEDFLAWEKAHPGRFRRIRVLSEEDGRTPENNDCRRGFITDKILSEAIDRVDTDLFICGPEAMHAHLVAEIGKIPVKPRRIRREDYGTSSVPSGRPSRELTVRIPGRPDAVLPADPGETVLVAMERGGLDPPSHCRTGSCGWCRGRLVEGDVEYRKKPAGVRSGDREHGNFHPCVAFPITDIIVEMPVRPASID